MELNDLIPERVEWRPSIEDDQGNKKELEFYFRPFTIEDEAWLKANYKDERLQEVFEKLESKEIAKLAYRQLTPVSKRELMKIKFIDVDDAGNDEEKYLTGPEKLGAIVAGVTGTVQLVDILLRVRGLSLPLLEKIIEKVGIDGLRELAHGRK